MEILNDLFDEKLIKIINIFLDSPEKRFCLTDISNLSRINVSTTFRILNKLVEKKIIKTIIIGKVRIYQLEANDKVFSLRKFVMENLIARQPLARQVSGFIK